MTLPPQMERLVVAWYGLLSGLSQNVGFALQAWTDTGCCRQGMTVRTTSAWATRGSWTRTRAG